MIYLNNAAGSYPKPKCVLEAVERALSEPLCENGRGVYGGRDILSACRQAVGRVLGIKDVSRIYFTSGATESFNLLVRGLVADGSEAAATAAEHNALLRPLYALVQADKIHIIKPDISGKFSEKSIFSALDGKSGVVFVNHCSNVTGVVQDIGRLAAAAHAAGAILVADVSQSAGAMPLDLEMSGVDAAVFTGHKAMFGPPGTGGFYLRPGLELKASKWGGTGLGGSKVFDAEAPVCYEVGTQNLCGLAGLEAGADFVWKIGLDRIAREILKKTERIYDALRRMKGVEVYTVCPESGIIAFNVRTMLPADLGYILYHGYGISVRTGFHCAPLLAEILGTPRGSVRISLSYFTSEADVDRLIEAVGQITKECGIEDCEDREKL